MTDDIAFVDQGENFERVAQHLGCRQMLGMGEFWEQNRATFCWCIGLSVTTGPINVEEPGPKNTQLGGPLVSLRQSLARFLVVIGPMVLFLVNATQCVAQSEGDNATPIAPLTISIKPSKSGIDVDRTTKTALNEVTVANETAQELIQGAYDMKDDQIVGAPGWLNSQRYDIEAKVDTSAAGQGELGGERILQALLSNRFKLAVHPETRLIPVYALVVADDGPKLRESVPADEDSALRVIQVENDRIIGREVPIATLARVLSEQLGRPVLDNTRLSSHYDVTLQWPTVPESSQPTILTAIQEQLGLKLEPRLMPKEFLVIDHVEIPSAD